MARGNAPPISMIDVANVMAARLLDPVSPRTQIAQAVGRDARTVAKIEDTYQGLMQQYVPLQKRKLLDDLDATRRAYLARLLDPDVLSGASAAQSAVIYGILHDKYALQAGMPTSINLDVHADMSVPDVLQRLHKAIQAKVGALDSGQTCSQVDSDTLLSGPTMHVGQQDAE